MGDIFGRVVAIFLTVVMFFGIPLVYSRERAKNACQMYILSEVTHFVDSVCNLGFADKEMIREFYDDLAKTGKLMDISMLSETDEYVRDPDTGNYRTVRTWHDTEDITGTSSYIFDRGDYFKVTVTVEDDFYFTGLGKDPTLSVSYGGTVKYEDE